MIRFHGEFIRNGNRLSGHFRNECQNPTQSVTYIMDCVLDVRYHVLQRPWARKAMDDGDVLEFPVQ
jgi:hypothetical protein